MLRAVQVRLLMLLLGSAQWRLFPLSVQLLSSGHGGLLVGLPQPPAHIPVTIAPIEVLTRPHALVVKSLLCMQACGPPSHLLCHTLCRREKECVGSTCSALELRRTCLWWWTTSSMRGPRQKRAATAMKNQLPAAALQQEQQQWGRGRSRVQERR
jgi:hypothetical protein